MTPEHMLLNGLGTPEQRFDALCRVATGPRVEMLRALTYESFLQTPYWRIVSRFVKRQRGRCNRCGASSRLEVHHRDYRHHGLEHEHLDDLEVLCRSCHAREHHLVVGPGEWRSVGELLPDALMGMAIRMEKVA